MNGIIDLSSDPPRRIIEKSSTAINVAQIKATNQEGVEWKWTLFKKE